MKKLLFLCIVFCISGVGRVHADGIVETLAEQTEKKLLKPVEIFIGVAQEKEKLLAVLVKEKQELVDTQQSFESDIKKHRDEISAKLTIIKNELEQKPDDDFLNKKMFILNETNQIVQDIVNVRNEIVSLLTKLIGLIEEFLQDPTFTSYQKKQKLQERLYYSFEDLQKLHEMVLDKEKRISHLVEEEKITRIELQGRKKTADATLAIIEKKAQELRELTQEEVDTQGTSEADLSIDLLRAEEQLHLQKKRFDTLQIRSKELRLELLIMQLHNARAELDIIKEYLRKIKPSIRVSEADIAFTKDELTKWKQEYYATKELYRKNIEELRVQLAKKREQLTQLSQRYSIPLGKELDDWTLQAVNTAQGYVRFFEIQGLNAAVLGLEKRIELLQAHIAAQDETLNYKVLDIQVKESYHDIVARNLLSDDQIVLELKKYEMPKAESKAKDLLYRDKINTVGEFISREKKSLEIIESYKKELEKKKDTLFKRSKHEYDQCFSLLHKVEKEIKNTVDVLSKTTAAYSGILLTVTNVMRLIAFIKSELESITIWYRPDYAVTWQGAQNISADITRFFLDIRSYITQFDISFFGALVKKSLQGVNLWMILLQLFLLLCGLLLIRLMLPAIVKFLQRIGATYTGIIRSVSFFCVYTCSFVYTYFFGFTIWLLLFVFLQFNLIPDPYWYAIFYLFSIPYWLWISYNFIQSFMVFNARNKYVLFAQDGARRFLLIFSVLLYSTVTLSLFRQAFMLANYYQSELPTILLAVNFIIFQISLILLISKEHVLSLIPTHSDFWRWMWQQVDTYYYLMILLISAIIVMSNPYVGFGRLVVHIFFGFLYTCALLIFLLWVYSLFKRIASRIFFSLEQDGARERFANAKSWFGLLIITSFIFFAVLGVLVTAHIWGWQFYVKDIIDLMHQPLLGKGTATPITAFSFLQIIMFIFGGFFVSYLLNHFVLDKIFDLLLVDAGVQHTVTRITLYIVVTLAVLFGFQNVGLGQLVSLIIGAMALSVGWVLKDPISDFVAYFIILVQRPIKIGDYIQLDSEIMGVVRKITARSIVLRRKNSTSIVVPNSIVTNKALVNWNYTRNYIAFNDILITISYKADPSRAKEILEGVLDKHPNILKNPPPTIRLDEFTEQGFLFMVRGYISSVYTLEQWNIASDVRLAIVKALRANNIEIAVPVRVIRSGDEIMQAPVDKLQ